MANKDTIEVPKDLLTKMAEFVKIAIDIVSDYEDKKTILEKKADYTANREKKFGEAVEKVSKILYDKDLLYNRNQCEEFCKKAAEDPSYALFYLLKTSNSAAATLIGQPSRVTTQPKVYNDPIYRKAFGGIKNVLDF